MTRNGEGDVTAHQARTPLKPASDTAATSAFLLVVFVLGQRHCILGGRAIRLPAFGEG
jgi:hypothetical protein